MIDGIPLVDLGPTALLGVLILLILVGRIVPRRTLEDVIKDRDEWRAALHLSEKARLEMAGQVDKLLEHAETTDSFIRALPYARLFDDGEPK